MVYRCWEVGGKPKVSLGVLHMLELRLQSAS